MNSLNSLKNIKKQKPIKMTQKETLVENDKDNQIDLNFAPPQQFPDIFQEFKYNIEKNYKKYLFIVFIVSLFGFSIYIENKGCNLISFIKNIKNNLGIKEQIDKKCYELEPMHLFELRLNNTPIKLCENESTEQYHICYVNKNNDYFYYKDGISCFMKNIILDPSKSSQTNIIYKGPVDSKYKGFPILDKGFFNINCEYRQDIKEYSWIYSNYLNSWNYKNNKEEELSELSPGKTIFFLSRNQDSPNLYHGSCELINALIMMELLNLKPEDIQIIFLESMILKEDPFYDLYKNIISRGGEPIYIRDLHKKYLISSAVHVPINFDSPAFLDIKFPNCGEYPGRAYKFMNDLIIKYMNITAFEDKFINDNEIYYYPQSVIDSHNANIKFKKYITIQWRKVWPKGRKGQYRILGNGPELAEKLAKNLPKDFLVRLVDTAGLKIREQISLMKKTDYLVGMHGAGLCLSLFMDNKSILHEVLPAKNMPVLTFMSAMSGHRTYSDILRSTMRYIDDSEYFFFKEGHFVKKVLLHMRENNYFTKF